MDDEASRPSPQGRNVADRVARRREAALAGHTGDEAGARRLLDDPDGGVRATALGALVRLGVLGPDDVAVALRDRDASVRRRLAELLPVARTDRGPGSARDRTRGPGPGRAPDDARGRGTTEVDAASTDEPTVLALLADADDTVVDAAAWAAGELWQAPDAAVTDDDRGDGGDGAVGSSDIGDAGGSGSGGSSGAGAPTGCPGAVLDELSRLVRDHDDSLVREAAVAALGSIGDERGLPAILHACGDKATVRRRAVLALAPFDGPEVDAALARAAKDRDWQVRQAAEDLLPEDPSGQAGGVSGGG